MCIVAMICLLVLNRYPCVYFYDLRSHVIHTVFTAKYMNKQNVYIGPWLSIYYNMRINWMINS